MTQTIKKIKIKQNGVFGSDIPIGVDADYVTTTNNKQFVSTEEKTKWGNKWDDITGPTKVKQQITNTIDKAYLNNITNQTLTFLDNNDATVNVDSMGAPLSYKDIADNLTTNSSTAVLSARMGKQLNEDLQNKYNQLKQKEYIDYGSNLLINGDFLIWQRGNNLTLNENSYGPDMWKVSTACTLKKDSQGLRIVSGDNITLTQYFMDTDCQGQTMTIIYSVNNVKKFKYISGSFFEDKMSIDITGLNTGDILNYVVLKKGDIIEYNHIKEDYMVAYHRCQRFIKSLMGATLGYVFGTWENIYFPIEVSDMYSLPTVFIDSSTRFNDVIGKGANAGNGFIPVSGQVITRDGHPRECIMIVMNNGAFEKVTYSVCSTTIINKPVIVTCEPQ